MDPVAPLPKKARALNFWRGLLPAALSGLLLALAYPPLSLWWLAYFALIPLYRALVTPKNALASGFVFALALFGVGMFWMNALATPLWIVLCLIMGVFFAAWAWLTARVVPHGSAWLRPLAFAAGWTIFEWVRSLGVYAFPWFLLASSQTHPFALFFAQVADLGGQWLVSFAIAAINGYVAEAIAVRSVRPALPALGIATALVGYGMLFGTKHDSRHSDGRPMAVAIVQGSEDKSANWQERLAIHVGLTQEIPEAALIVWPEEAVHSDYFSLIERLAREQKTPILTGMSAYERLDGEVRPRNIARRTGSSIEYVKRRLAPFGEVYPFRKPLAGLYRSFGVNVDSYQTGERPVVFDGVGPLICYESAFPWAVRATVREGAEVLAFLTSDQTFDGTPELNQHLALAQLRCIETRRFGVRAASSGISAAISPFGRVEERLENGQRGVLRASVAPLSGRTLATLWGDWWLFVCLGIALEATRRAFASGRSGRSA